VTRGRLWIAGALVLLAAGYLIVSSTINSARYYVTVAELRDMGSAAVGRSLTVSGAVQGLATDSSELEEKMTFDLVDIPTDEEVIDAAGGQEAAIHAAMADRAAPRVTVVYLGVPPDMLRDEAQAICRGVLASDGHFYADEILLKCPSRYEGDGNSVAVSGDTN
jgi:cytochrome c-type biogenesis protein CcmE